MLGFYSWLRVYLKSLVSLSNLGQGVHKINEILGGVSRKERPRKHVMDDTTVDVCSTKIFRLKSSKIAFGFRQTQQYLFYFITTTCFGQLIVIRPALQSSEQDATKCK
jgi:hypothetical protein